MKPSARMCVHARACTVCVHARVYMCVCVYVLVYVCARTSACVCTFIVYPFPDSYFLRRGSAVTMNHAPQCAQSSTVRLLLQVMATEAALAVGTKKLPYVS